MGALVARYASERVEPVEMLLLWGGGGGTGVDAGCRQAGASAVCFSEGALGQQRTSHGKNDRGAETAQRNERRGSKAGSWELWQRNSPGLERQVVRATER